MSCQCAKLPDAFYLDTAPTGFAESLKAKHHFAGEDWKRLCVCKVCDASWALDEWDKGHDQVASRVKDPSKWNVESEDMRKHLLLESRGGLTDERCVWQDCQGNQVKGVAYCLDHLYATGARR